MSKIIISQSQKDALAAARRAGESRGYLWSAIRSQYGIPRTLLLSVTCGRELYVKGTDPKQFLMTTPDGSAYSHAAVDAAPVPVQAATPSRFLVARDVPYRQSSTGWSRVDVAMILSALHDGSVEEIQDDVELPAGFPQGAADALVFDSDRGCVYFKAG